MTERALVLEVRLFNDRWHGNGDWPPSPFRLFQALIAGAFNGRWRQTVHEDDAELAFHWLEQLAPPLVLAPPGRDLEPLQYFVPNNDLDAVGNDPRRAAEIRASKVLRSRYIERDPNTQGDPLFIYAWRFSGGETYARQIIDLCERLHTFGHGIDPAYACGSIQALDDLNSRLIAYQGSVVRPDTMLDRSHDGILLQCPTIGSFDRLKERFEATKHRLRQQKKTTFFRQPPKPVWQAVHYDRSVRRLLFELRYLNDSQRFYPVRLEHAATVTKALRDLAAQRLTAVPAYAELVDRLIVGRDTTDADRGRRVRFIPLPSIGSRHADPSIRRMVVELPPDCPMSEADVRWALSGQRLPSIGSLDTITGEVHGLRLIDSEDRRMLRYYLPAKRQRTEKSDGAQHWQTVTPVVLPTRRRKGRIGGPARVASERSAGIDVGNALRHAGITANVLAVNVQREPFSKRGRRVEAFESDRFETSRLYHVEIYFADPVRGPLVIGDGRWLGLGLLRPISDDDTAGASAANTVEDIGDDLDGESSMDESNSDDTNEAKV